MKTEDDSWIRMVFKGNKVWIQSDSDGNPIHKDGKIRLKYRLDQDYEYWVNPQHVNPLDEPNRVKNSPKINKGSKQKKPAPRSKKMSQPVEKPPENAIALFTDGASSGNPGPAGVGVLFKYREHEKEISKYIGIATNNQAELEAIRLGLSEIKRAEIPVRVYTDSAYAHGVLMLGWKAKKNLELIIEIRKSLSRFMDLKIIHVKGHAGLEGNERADKLATAAIENNR
ncbi:MAG TPA: ribonuclease HI [Deltaproteobacteria bacterium]|nr:ribonuclease HI [Deltaproteobacteria bacterium]